MKMKIFVKFTSLFTVVLLCSTFIQSQIINVSEYGLQPKPGFNNSPHFKKFINKLKSGINDKNQILIKFEKGCYEFFPDSSDMVDYYISNHDQTNPKNIAFNLTGLNNIIFDGSEAEFLFHGRMLPMVLSECKNITIKNFSIDFANPHISQAVVLENDTINKFITYRMAPWVTYQIVNGNIVVSGKDWQHTPAWGVAFEKETKRIIYQNGDMGLGVKNIKEISPGVIRAPWNNKRLIPGSVIVMRSWNRPNPGIFIQYCVNTNIENVTVHYAEGMGLLAQMSENITLDKFRVSLKGDKDPRYFTTQADATHFSGCKGIIISRNGLYENMMDDAINIHGTYLKVVSRATDNKLICKYMHEQSWGFDWGYPGDTVQFINSTTMDILKDKNIISSIVPLYKKDTKGIEAFEIRFAEKLPLEISEKGSFGVENLEWTPSVIFTNNTIRNNRARGALFSTPKNTMVEGNIFDHTSGTAILLCGDCNGWYETGSCTDVLITNNKFLNALTSNYQFTNAVISIYPEIPDLAGQKQHFHGGKKGIVIENNYFETFDIPLLYAKSVNGLSFSNNTVKKTGEYKPFHWNKYKLFFEKVVNYKIEKNIFKDGFNKDKDLLLK